MGAGEEGRAGVDAESQLVAVQEGAGADQARDGGRRPFRARVLVSQRAAQRAVVALRDPGGGDSAEYRLEPLSGYRARARVGSSPLLPVAPLLGLFRRHLD